MTGEHQVLRSSLREFLCSEANHALGMPTTRAGSLITSQTMVVRDVNYDGNASREKASVVLRIAPSFLRFGSFEVRPPPLSHLTCVLELVRSPSATTRSSPPPLTLPTTPPPLLLLLLASSYSPYRPAALQSHMATWLHEHIPAPVALSQICKPRDPITGRAGPSVGQHTLLHELLTHVSGLLLPEEAKACAALAADHKAPSGKTEVRVRARARSRGPGGGLVLGRA